MNTSKTTTMLAALALALFLTAPLALAQQQIKGEVLLQEARHKEIIDGDLEEAISLYQKIVDNVSEIGRAVKARALVQMGKSYEKLGVHLVAEARQAYEQVVRDYPDQPDMVAEAQNRLEAFQIAVADAAGPDEPKALTMRKVISGQSYYGGSVSPNGRYFSTIYTGKVGADVGVYDIKTGEYRDVTHEGSWGTDWGYAAWSIWSPDSKQIAYMWEDSSGWSLRIVDMDGGEPRIIVPYSKEDGVPWAFDWSQDGKYILARMDSRYKSPHSGRIVLVDVETGSTRTLKDLPDGLYTHGMSLSPDGKYVVYASYMKGQRRGEEIHNIEIVSTDGQLDQSLIDHPANDHSPTWTPDGRHVVFTSDRSGQSGLWFVPVSEGSKVGEPQLITQALGIFSPIGFSDDGTYYYGSRSSAINVFVGELDLDAGTLQSEPQLVSTRFEGGSINELPFWSPDGSRLMYLSRRPDGVVNVFLVVHDMESDEERDLQLRDLENPNLLFRTRPHWSPDGETILVIARDREQRKRDLYIIDLETKRVTPIGLEKRVISVGGFMPDGQNIIFTIVVRQEGSPSRRFQIVRRHLESGSERVLREQSEGVWNLALSPDGAQLAYFEALPSDEVPSDWNLRDYRRRLVVMSFEEASTRTLWSSPKEWVFSSDVGLEWMPDGKHLLLATYTSEGEKQQLYLVNVESGERKAIGPVMQGENQITGVAVHPNGRTISFSRGHNVPEIWAIENIVFDQ